MSKIRLDSSNPNMESVRQVVFEKLRREPQWEQIPNNDSAFDAYIEYVNSPFPSGQLAFMAQDVIWQLMMESILAPGKNPSNTSLPWFHRTEHGKKVIEAEVPTPHDPTGYLDRLNASIARPDPTVIAYLSESLKTFRHNNMVATTVMLGIAAERVFLLLCESMADALSNNEEKDKFERILSRFAMKPKLDWVHSKIQAIQDEKPIGFPDNATVMITALFDFIRTQRNDLGHPQENPPALSREDALVNLQIFPRFYETAETVRIFLSTNTV